MKQNNMTYIQRKDGSLKITTINNEKTMTQQQYKDECDINNIMKKYATTGEFTHLTSKQGRYADFSNIESYQEMLDTVRYAQEAFASLPAETRKRFDNDPGQLLEFVQNPQNYEEGVKLGLVQPKPIPEPQNQSTNPQNPSPQPKPSKTSKTQPEPE